MAEPKSSVLACTNSCAHECFLCVTEQWNTEIFFNQELISVLKGFMEKKNKTRKRKLPESTVKVRLSCLIKKYPFSSS